MSLKSHATIIDDIQSLLGSNTTDFTDAILTLRLAEALPDFSRFSPFKGRETLYTTEDSKELDLSHLENLLWVDALEYRIDKDEREWREFTEHYHNNLSMEIDFYPVDEDSGIDTDEALDTSETGVDCDADATTAIPVGTVIRIDNELMYVTATGTTLTVVRGYSNTTGAAHTTDANIMIPEKAYLYCAEVHRVPVVADIAGAATAAYTAGVVTINVDGLTTTGTIEAGTTFTITGDGTGTHYRVLKDVVLSGGAGDFVFTPALAEAVANDDVVTFDNSTLTPRQETLLIDLVAARAAKSISTKFINEINVGGPGAWKDWVAWGEDKYREVLPKLEAEARRYQAVRKTWPRSY